MVVGLPWLGYKGENLPRLREQAMTDKTTDTIKTDEKRVACDGDGGVLGHPRVYLNLGKDGRAECPYCERIFILNNGPSDT